MERSWNTEPVTKQEEVRLDDRVDGRRRRHGNRNVDRKYDYHGGLKERSP